MKSYLRFLSRNKLYTAIEVVGLSVALAFVVFIATFVAGELGYDKDLKNTENIYIGHEEEFAIMSYTVGDVIAQEFPQVEEVCRFLSTSILSGLALEVTVEGETIPQKAIIADDNFFDFFTFPFIEGGLDDRDAVVVSQSFANTHFPEQSPICKTIQITVGENKKDLFIQGIYKDIKKSVFPDADIIYGTHHIKAMYPALIAEGNGTAACFYRLTPGTDIEELQEKAVEKLKDADILYRVGLMKKFLLSPFSKIHYGVCVQHHPFVGRIDFGFIMLFVAAGILLLVFALLNYISLTVAQIGFRASEMATRRLLGEQKWEIALRYIKEAFILTVISYGLALILIEVFGPHAKVLLGKDVVLIDNLGIAGVLLMVLFVFLVSLIAGIVPAMIMSKYKPIDIVKGEFATNGKMVLGKVFIGVQNVVTIATLCLALAMFVQFKYMLARDSGYEKDNIISIEGGQRGADYFVDELKQLPFVESVGWVQFSPVYSSRVGMTMNLNGEDVQMEVMYGDSTAFRLLGFNVMKYNQNVPQTNNSLWLTEGALKGMELDYETESVTLSGYPYPVCGIIRDFQRGNRTIEDCASSNMVWWNMEYGGEQYFPYLRTLVVKVSGDEQETVTAIKKFYEPRDNGGHIYVNDLNSEYRQWFKSDENNLKLISIFALLVIMLSSMAMLAMSTYYGKQQAKNWSVKKVFGCSRKEVFLSMAWGFIKVVGIAAVIAVPIGYFVIQRWLSSYSYRIDNYWWIYALAIIFILLAAVITISWQAVKLMNSNPIKELKKE